MEGRTILVGWLPCAPPATAGFIIALTGRSGIKRLQTGSAFWKVANELLYQRRRLSEIDL